MDKSLQGVAAVAALAWYIVRRLIQGLITLFIVTVIVFILFEAMPGSPIDRFTQDPNISPATLLQLRQSFGIDDPVYIRLLKFLRNMFTFDFGPSFLEGRAVSAVIADALPKTLFLFVTATVLTYVFGIVIGTFIAWRRGRMRQGSLRTRRTTASRGTECLLACRHIFLHQHRVFHRWRHRPRANFLVLWSRLLLPPSASQPGPVPRGRPPLHHFAPRHRRQYHRRHLVRSARPTCPDLTGRRSRSGSRPRSGFCIGHGGWSAARGTFTRKAVWESSD